MLENDALVDLFTMKELSLKNQSPSDEDEDLDMKSIDKKIAWDSTRSPVPK